MDTQKIIDTLQLKYENNWQFVDMTKWSSKSFYSYMIENGPFCLGWIAFVRRINDNSLKKHHFIRVENTDNISPYSLPRLLIVTDGKRWFVSKLNSEEFNEIRFSALLMTMHETLKLFVESQSAKVLEQETEYGIRATMSALKKAVRNIGEKKSEVKNHVPDLFSGNGETQIDDSYKAMYEVGKMRSDVLEKMLDMKNKEACDLKMILHHQLRNKFNDNVLQILINMVECGNKHMYLNISESMNAIIIKFLSCDMYSKEFRKEEMTGTYHRINQAGEIADIEVHGEFAPKLLKGGFFKLNYSLLKELLNNTKNGK